MLKDVLSRDSGSNLKEGRGWHASACRCVSGEAPSRAYLACVWRMARTCYRVTESEELGGPELRTWQSSEDQGGGEVWEEKRILDQPRRSL